MLKLKSRDNTVLRVLIRKTKEKSKQISLCDDDIMLILKDIKSAVQPLIDPFGEQTPTYVVITREPTGERQIIDFKGPNVEETYAAILEYEQKVHDEREAKIIRVQHALGHR